MIKIGVYAFENTQEIIDALLLLLKSSNNSVIIKNYPLENTEISCDFILIPFKNNEACPIPVDILILDNPNNLNLLNNSFINYFSENTILIYNTDNGFLPKIEHPKAIDYGFSQNSSVTISSIKYNNNLPISFILSVQKSFTNIFGNSYPIGETIIFTNSDFKIENSIPAVICNMICTNKKISKLKI